MFSTFRELNCFTADGNWIEENLRILFFCDDKKLGFVVAKFNIKLSAIIEGEPKDITKICEIIRGQDNIISLAMK